MNDNTSKSESQAVGYQEMETAVLALKGLIAEGNESVLLSRMGRVRFAGDIADFQRALSALLARDVDAQESAKALSEITRFCRLAANVDDIGKAIPLLEQHAFAEEFKKLSDEPGKESLRSILRKKLELAASLFPPAFSERKQ